MASRTSYHIGIVYGCVSGDPNGCRFGGVVIRFASKAQGTRRSLRRHRIFVIASTCSATSRQLRDVDALCRRVHQSALRPKLCVPQARHERAEDSRATISGDTSRLAAPENDAAPRSAAVRHVALQARAFYDSRFDRRLRSSALGKVGLDFEREKHQWSLQSHPGGPAICNLRFGGARHQEAGRVRRRVRLRARDIGIGHGPHMVAHRESPDSERFQEQMLWGHPFGPTARRYRSHSSRSVRAAIATTETRTPRKFSPCRRHFMWSVRGVHAADGSSSWGSETQDPHVARSLDDSASNGRYSFAGCRGQARRSRCRC